MTHPLVALIRNAVEVYPKPCVNISGGLDSTIILHHLAEKTDEPIYTYTVGFKSEDNEFAVARHVADHYGTHHTEVYITHMLDRYPAILKHFAQPRFNLWPYWVAEQAKKDGRESCYIGEACDEHFGGYWYKPQQSYVEHWSNFFTYVHSTYQTIYDHFTIRLVAPFHPNNLNWQLTYPYYDHTQQKQPLREAYKDELPAFLLNRTKHNGRFSYWVIWEEQLKPYFPDAHPETEDDIRLLLNQWVTRAWLDGESNNSTIECDNRGFI